MAWPTSPMVVLTRKAASVTISAMHLPIVSGSLNSGAGCLPFTVGPVVCNSGRNIIVSIVAIFLRSDCKLSSNHYTSKREDAWSSSAELCIHPCDPLALLAETGGEQCPSFTCKSSCVKYCAASRYVRCWQRSQHESPHCKIPTL